MYGDAVQAPTTTSDSGDDGTVGSPVQTGSICGNGLCEADEINTCLLDCPRFPVCGDGLCEPAEQESCPDDCIPPPPPLDDDEIPVDACGEAGHQEIIISSDLQTGSTNNDVGTDSRSIASFSFNTALDMDAAQNSITVWVRNSDDVWVHAPYLNLMWQDTHSVALHWPASYNELYVVQFAAGLAAVDPCQGLSSSTTYYLRTAHNPYDIDGTDGDRADAAWGSDLSYVSGGALMLTGGEMVPDLAVEMPIMCNMLEDISCVDNLDHALSPWVYGVGTEGYASIGAAVRNLRDVSGSALADLGVSAVENIGAPYCLPGQGTCSDGCRTPETDTGVSCGCPATYTCGNDGYCMPPVFLDVLCTDDSECAAGLRCIDGLCTTECGETACDLNNWMWSCSEDTQTCISPSLYYGPCLQDQQGKVLLWDDIESAAPTGTILAESLGTSLAAWPVGDINSDGRSDMLVIESEGPNDANVPQTVYLITGTSALTGEISTATAAASWAPPAPAPAASPWYPNAVTAVTELGDVNGDGYNDFAIGYQGQGLTAGQASVGIVEVHLGSASLATVATPSANIVAASTSDMFGISLSGGDVDGDGRGDLVVGAPTALSGGEVAAGLVYMFRGQTLSGNMDPSQATAVFAAPATANGDELFGFSVLVADMNGDGISDIAIASPMQKTLRGTGRIYGFFGRESWASTLNATNADFLVNNNVPDEFSDLFSTTSFPLGVWMEAIGDINNDGYKDFAAGSVPSSKERFGSSFLRSNDQNFVCTFLGGPDLDDTNIVCDNSPAIIMATNPPPAFDMFFRLLLAV